MTTSDCALQISDAAQESSITTNLHDLDCFVAGAEWADNNPAINLPEILGNERAFWIDRCSEIVKEMISGKELQDSIINQLVRI